jgi:hypothetical protein
MFPPSYRTLPKTQLQLPILRLKGGPQLSGLGSHVHVRPISTEVASSFFVCSSPPGLAALDIIIHEPENTNAHTLCSPSLSAAQAIAPRL